ncbi:2-phosphosulfolactate phosphatase [Paenibacillus agricola]|uniref:Probable 2-phosphosulfolactate phosphatase n=1 Tax=Paenibacillus agricola TaxID=2716264 RepID=A0ABX0IZI8_9BACL|nr:2-phosphosulfolactate phosphatase [Paenibacillus agricola]NHN28848.1 2-phosphosulfolactate phosphatase [Paenibacillus agricola]
MDIQVIPYINEACWDDLAHKTVIVIDVLRATSTIVTALAHGCEAIYPVETVLEAKQLKQEHPSWLTGGERSCKKIPGFNFGNSPFEYLDDQFAGYPIILTTTNGTRAIRKAHRACTILIASLLNGRACASEAAALNKDIVLLCSGTQDVFSFEDGICAGQIIEELYGAVQGKDVELHIDDFGLSMLYAFRHIQPGMTETLLHCSNGKRLTKLGFREDVTYCSQMNLIQLVPIVVGDRITALPVRQSQLASQYH